MTTNEEYLRKAAKLCAEMEQAYKVRLFHEVIKPMIDSGLMFGPPGNESWYSFRSFDELISLLGDRLGHDALFRIPTACGNWFNAEIDPKTSKPFRFFSGSAWLILSLPENSQYIRVTVVHAIERKVLDNLVAKADGTPLQLVKREVNDHGRTMLYFALPEVLQSTTINFELSTDIMGVPALKYENSADWRRLSAAVFYPDAVQ